MAAYKNDLTMYSVSFDTAGYMNLMKRFINQGLDVLSGHMHDVLVNAINGLSEASGIMKNAATSLVREHSRTVTDTNVEIEVGVDPAEAGGEQMFIRASVTLFGNGSIWARANGSGWTKHVGAKHKNRVKVDYHIPQFEQSDHSAAMLANFYKEIQKYAKDFLNTVMAQLAAVDMSQFLIVQ